MRLSVFTIVLMLLSSVMGLGSASALEFMYVTAPSDNTKKIIFADGAITSGDAQQFVTLIEQRPDVHPTLVINSGGGSVLAALELAEEIEKRAFMVVVDGHCASACAQIIFPAGEYAIMTPGSLLGIHTCYINGQRDDLCNEAIAQVAVSRGFPYGTLDMFSNLYGPSDMKWMGEVAARCFGFYHMPGDPRPIHGPKPCVDGVLFTLDTQVEGRPFGPSFDCESAIENVEVLICLDKEIMLVDSILGRVYDTVRAGKGGPQKESLRREQRDWISQRNRDCERYMQNGLGYGDTRQAVNCLYQYNSDRIYTLLAER